MARAREHLEELLKLPAEERSSAAEELLASLESDQSDPEAEQAWADEIATRIERDAPGIPAEQVFAEGRARLKGGE